MDNGSMDSGSHGHERSAPSSSNLSALAPPFTVVTKPIVSSLGDWTEFSYGVPLSSSLHNWLPSDYPDSGLGLYSNHGTEYDPIHSSDAYDYGASHDIHSPYTHLSSVNPIAPVSVDGVATSNVEAQLYYPSYIPLPIEDHDPMVVPDETSYDLSSSSHVVTLDGSSSKNDHTQSGCHLEGGFCSKELSVSGSSSIFMNDANLGAQASKGSYTCEEGSNIIDMLGWEKHSGCSNTEWPSNKSFPVNNLPTMPIDYSKTSTIGAPSLLIENPPKKPSFEEVTKMYECQVPCIASYEKHIRHCNASMRGSASCETSSPSLVIRPPDVDTSMSAPNTGAPSLLLEKPHKKYSFEEITQMYEGQVPCIASHEKHIRQCNASMSGSASCETSSPSLAIRPPDVDTSMSAPNTGPLEDMNFGTDVTDPNACGNSPSYANESFPLLGSKNKVRFDTSQLRMHLDTNDSISMESLSLKNEELSKKKEISEDALDQVFKPKSGFQISRTSSDGFNLTLDPIENSSESLDYYNPVVDSPCWKGAPVICFPPFEASEAIGSQYMRKIESCNSSDCKVPKVFPLAIDNAVKFSSQNPNEKTMYVGRGLAPAPKGPSDANSLFRDPRSDGSLNANDGSFLSKSCYDYTVQHTDSICEPWEDHALPSMSTVGSDLTLSLTRQQNFESSKMIPEKHSSETCVEDPGSSISDATSSPDVSFYSSGYGLSSSSSVEDSSAKLTELHEPDSTPKIDVQMLINIMRNMSDLLLFHSSNDSLELKDGDCEVLKDVIFNLHRCILKDGEQMTATRESIFPQQGTSQYLEDLPKLPKEVNVDRPRVTKEAAVITRDQLDHKGLHEEKHHNIGSGNKMEMISDFVSVKGGANMVEKDNMTQAIMKVLSDNCDHEEEMQPNGFLYKTLWLEAEAELCSINYKARYNRMRIEMEKSELHEAKVNTLDVEKRLRSKAYCDLNAVDKLIPKAKVGPYSGISIQDIPSMQHVMARYGILKHRIDHSNSATTLEEVSSSKVYPELNKVDQLTPETAQAKCPAHDMSIQTSPIISPTCHANDVMARFNILEGQGGCINPIKATNVEEPPTSSVSPLLNEVKKDTLILDISIQNSPISTSPNTDDVEDSIMTRFHILKCRDDNSRSMDVKRQEPTEVFHLGFSGEKNHQPISSERSEDGSVDVKLGPVLQHRTANSPEDKLTVKEFHLREDDPTVQSRHSNRLGDPLAAGWYDSSSSDWEHVTEEELMG
ncbi:hypothetical protein F2P56_035275 [Juglans regia]|uniref:Uncharacterized protein n=1 Tax=Juglans regia TaxID=51240 RepID=A0A833SIT6_JUGRE|nr:hypothetical protein F2P56_035275 [Juglans regia]